jgi:hypothetical protein
MRKSGNRRKKRPPVERAFVRAMYYSGFGQDVDTATTPRERRYVDILESAAAKLSRAELRLLGCIADGIDLDGSSLRQEQEDEEACEAIA